MSNRYQYSRPQAVIWADDYETNGGVYVPAGTEFSDFIILSDHNRQAIDIKQVRIENRKRMINGTMRSYHIADKDTFSWSWNLIPSRAFSEDPVFGETGLLENSPSLYTVDKGAGGVDIKSWYQSHRGAFYMLLSYDQYDEFAADKYNHLREYSRVVKVMFADFSSTVEKRGGTNHDLWNISVTLEEV
jgi:hypothetical protein